MSAALHAVRMGARVTVLEREARVGGLCGTQERNGFRFDFGGHRFLARDAEMESFVRELVGTIQAESPAKARRTILG